MSVLDETWDRPICKFCSKVIIYGTSKFHKTAQCIKDKIESLSKESYEI